MKESLINANEFSKPKFRTTQEIMVPFLWSNYSGIPLEKNMTYEFLFIPISVFETLGELVRHLDGARFYNLKQDTDVRRSLTNTWLWLVSIKKAIESAFSKLRYKLTVKTKHTHTHKLQPPKIYIQILQNKKLQINFPFSKLARSRTHTS